MPTLHTPVRAPSAHSDGRESRRAATNLDVWGGPWGTELQPVCAPPCAPQAVCRAGNSCECSLGYEGDGRTCTGEQGCRGGGPPPLPSRYPVQPRPPRPPQWWTCARMGVVAAASTPTAARRAQRLPAPAGQTTRATAGAAGPATPVRMATAGAAASTPTA